MAGNEARFDRAAALTALWGATRGSQVDRVRLAVMCAAAGSNQANSGQSLASLLAEIDALEATLFEKLEETAGRSTAGAPESREHAGVLAGVLAGVRQLHGCCARMRAAAAAGFSHAAASSARKRVRTARHDIVNKIGTVRNAILLMDDEPDQADRERFQAIAKRNSVASEQLVRRHLGDDSACGGARAASIEDAAELIAAELTTCADRRCTTETLEALRELAGLLGVAVLSDDATGGLRVKGAASRRDEGNDLGRAREGNDVDAVGL
ncbi:MAG TPA: hypothetical protein VH277_02455 [Gemmatimonadaceae bacterium]|nr:hypothetical protein [Gemmatimonadaceae bacterium]